MPSLYRMKYHSEYDQFSKDGHSLQPCPFLLIALTVAVLLKAQLF